VKHFLNFVVLLAVASGAVSLVAAEAGPSPITARDWNTRGIELSRSGEKQQAVEAFSRAVQVQPKLADPYLNRAIVFIKLKEWKKAEADCTKAIELDPDNARSYHQRAVIRSQMGLHEAAFKDASRAVRMEPTNPSMVFTRFLACSRLGRHDLGHFAGETYIGIQSWADPWSPYMALLNSVSLRRAGYDEESRAILEETTKWLNRGDWPMPLVLYLHGDIPAENVMELATDNDRKTLAHFYIGVNEWLNGDAASARPHFEWVRDKGNKDFLQHMLAEDYLKELVVDGANGK